MSRATSTHMPSASTSASAVAGPSGFWDAWGSDGALLLWTSLTAAVLISAASIPQGWHAEQLLRAPEYGPLRTLDRLGLTRVWASPWFWAAASGWLGAIVLSAARPRRRGLDRSAEVELRARRPERTLQALLRWGRQGAEVHHEPDVSRVRFSPADRSWLLQAGLWLTFVASAFALKPADPDDSIVRARLSVLDVVDGSRGRFDMAQGESIQFFGKRVEHTVVTYVPDKDGLGPAVQMTRSDPVQGSRSSFWVYGDAPPDFDARHRGSTTAIALERARIVARPGSGLAARPASWLLLLALMVAGLGWTSLGQRDRWEFEVRGDRVRARVTGPEPEASLDRLAPSLAEVLAR
ncbi:MAG TPA: hypothetical protein RMG48_16085 [Myxococcales bacterium LLY-WYZ-16_1]|jgi:hypothetical protein|nr:hypothetical protein [Myxococcales bacterium LLY-WYZ-16_1]